LRHQKGEHAHGTQQQQQLEEEEEEEEQQQQQQQQEQEQQEQAAAAVEVVEEPLKSICVMLVQFAPQHQHQQQVFRSRALIQL